MIRVLVVDDSMTARLVVSRELARHADIVVIGTAADAFEARRLIVALHPDVITLDLQLPRMNGLEFLEKLMTHYPTPVVVVSSIAPENSETALRALHLGAIDVVAKARLGSHAAATTRLVDAIRVASVARLPRRRPGVLANARFDSAPAGAGRTLDVIAVGASTGGTRAIEELLRVLPPELPGMVIAQHLPAAFTASFAQRLSAVSPLLVREARDGDVITAGTVLIGPGDHNISIRREGTRLTVCLLEVTRPRQTVPSVDLLFRSVAAAAGSAAAGVLLTGMGDDGAHGLLELRRRGAFTIAEAEATCVVFGMPRVAISIGAACAVAPLHDIPDMLLDQLSPAR